MMKKYTRFASLSVALSKVVFSEDDPRRRYHAKTLAFKGIFIDEVTLLPICFFLHQGWNTD
jgi:hypothetical protein